MTVEDMQAAEKALIARIEQLIEAMASSNIGEPGKLSQRLQDLAALRSLIAAKRI